MTTEIKFILMPAHELSKLLEDACERAIAKVLTEQNDELLSIVNCANVSPGWLITCLNNSVNSKKFKVSVVTIL